jgi:hypothetical protein
MLNVLRRAKKGQIITVVIDVDKRLHKVSIEIKQVFPIEEIVRPVMNNIFQESMRCVSRHFTIQCNAFFGIMDTIDVVSLPKEEIRIRNSFYHGYRSGTPVLLYDAETFFEETDQETLILLNRSLEDLYARKREIQDQIDNIDSEISEMHEKKRKEILQRI